MDFRETKKYKDGIFFTKKELEKELFKRGFDTFYYALSFGAGTQSTHLLEDHFQGKIYYDYIIMSDTGAEPQFIHKQVAWWQQRQKDIGNNTPFFITKHYSMDKGLEEMLMAYIFVKEYNRLQLPLYFNTKENGIIKPAGMMKRQCTVDYKIVPVKRLFRQLILKKHGLLPNQRMPKNIALIMDIGFSLDEIKRIRGYGGEYDYKYCFMAYPLVEQNLTTDDSIKFLKDNNFPSKRSRCYLCPFNCDKKDIGMDWMEIIQDEPLSFVKACWFDAQLRIVQDSGVKRLHSIPYFHYSRKSLASVYYKEYIKLYEVYKYDLEKWINDWKDYINKNTNKYK